MKLLRKHVRGLIAGRTARLRAQGRVLDNGSAVVLVGQIITDSDVKSPSMNRDVTDMMDLVRFAE